MDKFTIIVILTVAGPLIGSWLGVFKRYTEGQIDHLLAFAAGVMVSVSLFELLPDSYANAPLWLVAIGLLLGAVLMHALNKAMPHFHHAECKHPSWREQVEKTALFVLVGIAVHNIPEGAAIGIGALANFHFAPLIALAIALHDIPETICIAAPYYAATGKRARSFWISFLTVVPTGIGLGVTYFLLGAVRPAVLGAFISFTAGVMLYISLAEIVPVSFVGKMTDKRVAALSFLVGALLVLIMQYLLAAQSGA